MSKSFSKNPVKKSKSKEFFSEIYDSWKPKQFEKFEDLFSLLLPYLFNVQSVLDLGVGKAWFEEFLESKGQKFSRIVGVDISEQAVSPRRLGVEYVLSKNFSSQEKFDLVVCIDSLHLLSDKNILRFCKPEGIALICLPESKKSLLEIFPKRQIIMSTIVGRQEKDQMLIIKA